MEHDGFVNLSRLRREDGSKEPPSESRGRISGDFGDFALCDEPCCELFAKERCAQQMPLEREMLPDRPEAREKFLCAFRVAKAPHAPLAFACRLVTVLCTVVQSGRSFDEHVFHFRKLRDLRFCRRIAAQLISDDLARHGIRAQHPLEETFGRGLVAPLLHQDVEFGAMLVDRTPQQVGFAAQRNEHLVKVPRAARIASRRFYAVSKALAKFVAPASDRLVCHGHTALEEQFLDVAQAQLKAEIPAHSATDYLGWETMTVIERFRFLHRAILRHRPNNLTTPLRSFRQPVWTKPVRRPWHFLDSFPRDGFT
jgi:hypothetical protein